MKPEDIKMPFRWNERTILIKDRIWFVPDYYDKYDEFTFPGWDSPEIFNNANPVRVEYCSGNGTWIAAKSEMDPNSNWVAVEKRFVRVRKIGSKVHNKRLTNLLSVCGEAYNVTSRYFPNQSVDEVFINFPDPWPKKRHAKHRLIQAPFLTELSRILKPQGCVTIVTDDPDYSALLLQEFQMHPSFDFCYPEPYFLTDMPNYGTSYFEELWRHKGKVIRYHRFSKKEAECHENCS